MNKLSTEHNQRFEGALGGSEYDLLKLAMPHYDEVEAEVGIQVQTKCFWMKAEAIKVLEIGPGSGITTRVLLDADSRIHITAVDSSRKMVADLADEFKASGQDCRVDLVEQEIESYLRSVPDGEFDVVASAFVLHNLERGHRSRVMGEIFRVLKPSGLLVNADKLAHDDMERRAQAYVAQVSMLDKIEQAGRPDVKAEWVEHYKVDEQPHIVYIESEALAQLRGFGFTGVRVVYRHLMEAVFVAAKPGEPGS